MPGLFEALAGDVLDRATDISQIFGAVPEDVKSLDLVPFSREGTGKRESQEKRASLGCGNSWMSSWHTADERKNSQVG